METFIGHVYDIDYLEANGWCQFLVRNDDDPNSIDVVTDNHSMQTILETAMMMRQQVEVTFNDKENRRLIRVKLNIG